MTPRERTSRVDNCRVLSSAQSRLGKIHEELTQHPRSLLTETKMGPIRLNRSDLVKAEPQPPPEGDDQATLTGPAIDHADHDTVSKESWCILASFG